MDRTSIDLAGLLRQLLDFNEIEEFNGSKRFKYENITLIEIKDLHINAYYLDDYKTDSIIFLSKHSSSKGVPSFTVHAEGNWSEKAELGGLPHQLSVASPIAMLKLLNNMGKLNQESLDVTYEATHHGPFLKTPSLFIELGGNTEVMESAKYQEIVSKSVSRYIDEGEADGFSKIVVGIGSNHYPNKFSSLAFGRGYAFSHIMPKYYTTEYGMLDQAFSRSVPKPESAVIDWKSIKSEERNKIIGRLNEIGMDYEKV